MSSASTGSDDAAAVLAGEQDAVALGVVVQQHAALAVEEVVLVGVARLHDLVADAQAGAGDRRAVGVQPRAQLGVERVDPQRPLVHRREHLDVGGRIEAVVRRQPRRRELADLGEDRLRPVARDEEEVAHVVRAGGGVGQLAGVDRVRRADDERARGLAEDLGQPRRGHGPAGVARGAVAQPARARAGPRARARARPARAGRRRRRAARACAARPPRAAPRRGGPTASTPRRR